MKFSIKLIQPRRVKLDLSKKLFSNDESIKLVEYVRSINGVSNARLYDRIGELSIYFYEDSYREKVLECIKNLDYNTFSLFEPSKENVTKIIELNKIKKHILRSIIFRYIGKYFLPAPLNIVRVLYKSSFYIKEAYKAIKRKKLEVSILDATAIATSILRNDFATASSVMFLLEIGELLEDYTHKRAVAELSRSLAINVETVWKQEDGYEIEVPFTSITTGDVIVVRAGNLIPFDGTVIKGLAMVNQSALTGESVSVEKGIGKSVYAATVVEDGELVIRVDRSRGQSRIDEIIKLIESSEKNKSQAQINAYNRADSLVKYSFAGFGLTYLLTRNINKALSFLMVDFSCAIKICTPMAIMSAMKQCSDNGILVKGGKYLEKLAESDIIVFDKTGTLTKSVPTVRDIIPLNGYNREEVLKISACLEEHFPHSIANAVVQKAIEDKINHEELHGEVKYVVAHGIASEINGEKAIIGSYHFIFEDEGIKLDYEVKEIIDNLPDAYSYLYLAVGKNLAGIIVIEDPIKDNAKQVISMLKNVGIKKVVMLTGDNEKTARKIAEELDIDEYKAEVLPSDKSTYIEELKKCGKSVIMVGDGVNDSPALSIADVGISMNSGSDIAKEVSDVQIKEDRLEDIVYLIKVSKELKKKIARNYSTIVAYNSSLIGLGLFNIIMPNNSALLHNIGTVIAATNSMQKYNIEVLRNEEFTEDSKCNS